MFLIYIILWITWPLVSPVHLAHTFHQCKKHRSRVQCLQHAYQLLQLGTWYYLFTCKTQHTISHRSKKWTKIISKCRERITQTLINSDWRKLVYQLEYARINIATQLRLLGMRLGGGLLLLHLLHELFVLHGQRGELLANPFMNV